MVLYVNSAFSIPTFVGWIENIMKFFVLLAFVNVLGFVFFMFFMVK